MQQSLETRYSLLVTQYFEKVLLQNFVSKQKISTQVIVVCRSSTFLIGGSTF